MRDCPTLHLDTIKFKDNGNVMNKSVVSRMSLRTDKDVETYLLKSRSDDNEKNELL
jgi:hypothetical protein